MKNDTDIIDHICKCEEVLNERDVNKAKLLRKELTRIYSGLIPRWNHGLMACITEFYLMIRDYKSQINGIQRKANIVYFMK